MRVKLLLGMVFFALIVCLWVVKILPWISGPSTPAPAEVSSAIHWPSAWRVRKPSQVAENEGISDFRVERLEEGEHVAGMHLIVAKRDSSSKTLQSFFEQFTSSADESAGNQGMEVTQSAPVDGAIAGQPTIDVERQITVDGVAVQQSITLMLGKESACALVYAARSPYYDRYKKEFVEARSSFRCP